MKETQEMKEHSSGRRLDLLLLAILFGLGFGVRLLYSRAVVFPPLDDPAFYLTTATNLISGRGLVVDVLWSYHGSPMNVSHPSHEIWMPLTTALIAAAFAVAKPSLQAAQTPGVILGSLLVPFTYVLGRRALPGGRGNRPVAFGAALLVAINATLGYQSSSVDSSALFALLAASALATSVGEPRDKGRYFLTGLLIALAYLTRAHALFLLLAIPLAWWFFPIFGRSLAAQPNATMPGRPSARSPQEYRSKRTRGNDLRPGLGPMLEMLGGFFLLVTPWLVRNYIAFGTPLPGSALDQAWLRDYVDSFNYVAQPTWQTMLARGWPAILAQRGQALWHNGAMFLLSTFPWGLLALPGFWLLRKERFFHPPLVYLLLLFFATAIVFPVSSLTGMFYHSLGATIPILALAAAYTVEQGTRRFISSPGPATFAFGTMTVGLLVLAAFQVASALPTIAERHEAEKEQFKTAASWLAKNASPGDVVMTTQPYTLNYVSGHPCIALPGNESPDSAWSAAQRYGAVFLVITQVSGQYPQILHDRPDPRFKLVEAVDGLEIYDIAGGNP
jgi:hypothetical protein